MKTDYAVHTFQAAAYIRLSDEDGDKTESNSVVNQKELISRFVSHNDGINIRQFYTDDGYTGTNFDEVR